MRSLSIAVLWLAPSLALAQTAGPADLFGPANPQMKTPPTTYRSVFDARPQETEKVPWRNANEEVGRLGGHIGILREDQPPAPDHAGHQSGAAAAAPGRQNPTGHHHE